METGWNGKPAQRRRRRRRRHNGLGLTADGLPGCSRARHADGKAQFARAPASPGCLVCQVAQARRGRARARVRAFASSVSRPLPMIVVSIINSPDRRPTSSPVQTRPLSGCLRRSTWWCMWLLHLPPVQRHPMAELTVSTLPTTSTALIQARDLTTPAHRRLLDYQRLACRWRGGEGERIGRGHAGNGGKMRDATCRPRTA